MSKQLLLPAAIGDEMELCPQFHFTPMHRKNIPIYRVFQKELYNFESV
jgi:hypothetical protein